MPTSISDTLFDFSVSLASAARVFTTRQLATHPCFRDRTRPVTRAQQFLWEYPKVFEKTRGAGDEPWLWRLTAEEKRRRQLAFKSIAGDTQRRSHWLGLGDLWLALTYAGGRPQNWSTEPNAQFDVMLEWQSKMAVVEYQRSSITSKQWDAKWSKRREWYKAQQFDHPIAVVLVVTTNQSDNTIHAPKGTIVCHNVNDVPRVLSKWRL